MLIARQSERPGEGMMLSAIAGTNDPAINHHSHNDIGHFNVYLNGVPVIIDLGHGNKPERGFVLACDNAMDASPA